MVASSISSSGLNSSTCNRLQCEKIVLFDPRHSDISVLKLTLQLPIESGHFQDAVPRSDISGNPSHHSENKFLQYDTKGSRFQYLKCGSWYRRTLRSSSHPSFTFHRVSWCQSARRWCRILWILEESRGWSFSSRQAFKKSFLKYLRNSVYRAAIQNRGQAHLRD